MMKGERREMRLYARMVGLVQINGYHFGPVIREKLSFYERRAIPNTQRSWRSRRIFNRIAIPETLSPSFSRNKDATAISLFRFPPAIPPRLKLSRSFPGICDSHSGSNKTRMSQKLRAENTQKKKKKKTKNRKTITCQICFFFFVMKKLIVTRETRKTAK